MKTQELKINVPQGYEIDKENSTFEKIIFKEIEKKLPMSFDEIGELDGFFIETNSEITAAISKSDDKRNLNIWKSKELAKASLALNQLIWLRDEWNDGWVADWENLTNKYCVCFVENRVEVFSLSKSKRVLSFKDVRTAESFANQFESLINEAKPLL